MNGLEWLYQSDGSWDHRIPRGQAVLLSSGDQLRLCDKTLITFKTRIPASQLLTSTQIQEQDDPDCRQVLEKAVKAPRNPLQLQLNNFFHKAFDNVVVITDRKLGSGFSGRVFMAIDRQLQDGQLACKIVQLRKCHDHHIHKCSESSRSMAKMVGNKAHTAKIWREVELLRELSHVSRETSTANV